MGVSIWPAATNKSKKFGEGKFSSFKNRLGRSSGWLIIMLVLKTDYIVVDPHCIVLRVLDLQFDVGLSQHAPQKLLLSLNKRGTNSYIHCFVHLHCWQLRKAKGLGTRAWWICPWSNSRWFWHFHCASQYEVTHALYYMYIHCFFWLGHPYTRTCVTYAHVCAYSEHAGTLCLLVRQCVNKSNVQPCSAKIVRELEVGPTFSTCAAVHEGSKVMVPPFMQNANCHFWN